MLLHALLQVLQDKREIFVRKLLELNGFAISPGVMCAHGALSTTAETNLRKPGRASAHLRDAVDFAVLFQVAGALTVVPRPLVTLHDHEGDGTDNVRVEACKQRQGPSVGRFSIHQAALQQTSTRMPLPSDTLLMRRRCRHNSTAH